MSIPKMIKNARAGEVDFVAKRIVEIYDRSPIPNDPHLASLFNGFKVELFSLASAIDLSKSESNLEEIDDHRDASFGACHGLCFGYTHHIDPVISSSAKQIFSILDKHGRSVTQEPYAIESSHLDAMILQIEEPSMMALARNLPGFEPLFIRFKQDEIEFGRAFTQWKEKKAVDNSQAAATELKKSVIRTLNEDITLHLDAMSKVDGSRYGQLAQTVAQIIADSNSQINSRKKSVAQ